MQEEASGVVYGRAVDFVARHGMPDAGQVYADLMGPASADADVEQREGLVALPHAPLGERGAALGLRRLHFETHDHAATDGLVDEARVGFHRAVHQRDVMLFDGAVAKLLLQLAVYFVVARHQQHAGRVTVEPMDDAGALIAAHRAQGLVAMKERVHQGAGVYARTFMYRHAGLLVDGHHARVFVKHVERNVLGAGV